MVFYLFFFLFLGETDKTTLDTLKDQYGNLYKELEEKLTTLETLKKNGG